VSQQASTTATVTLNDVDDTTPGITPTCAAKCGSPDLSVGRFIGSGTARVYWSRLVRDIAAIIQGVKLALCLCQALTTCWAYPDDNPQRSGGASAGVRGAGPRGPGCRCAQAAVRPGRSGQQPPRSSIAMAISASGSW
jgi:hypothetical protein